MSRHIKGTTTENSSSSSPVYDTHLMIPFIVLQKQEGGQIKCTVENSIRNFIDDTETYLNSALEITGENLEDLLAYDDLFLDYFNAFLALPVFPQHLTYNRLTGAFDELDGSVPSSATGSNGSNGSVGSPVPYGPTDEERERLLDWARKERLPLFLSTQLFREFKLCKLLLRPLDDRYSASRGSSRQIRGYSRQSESYISSLSNSADNSAPDEMDDEEYMFFEGHVRHSSLFPYKRPGSQALSVPGRYFYGAGEYESTRHGSTTTGTQDSSRILSQSAKVKKSHRGLSDLELIQVDKQNTTLSEKLKERERGQIEGSWKSKETATVKFDTKTIDSKSRKSSRSRRAPRSEAEEAFLRQARVLSAPVNYEDYMKHPIFGDFDYLFGEEEPNPDGQVYVKFDDEGVSEARTETDVKNMEGRLKMSLQQLKENVLGMYTGMEEFKEFLQDTAGNELINFWLDCEFFKDTTENIEDSVAVERRNRLFRDIQDKYKMNLTKEAQQQISKSASNATLSHTIFIRTQYDVLRRLRAYWVPRFLIHEERLRELRTIGSEFGIAIMPPKKRDKHFVPFFPSISLVNSMPVKPDDVLTYSKTKSWDFISKGGRHFDDRVTSAKFRVGPPAPPSRMNKNRFVMALAVDKIAGGPFLRYLEKKGDKKLLSQLLFWQDVTEYGLAEDRSADRLLRLCQAWNIYNTYLAPNSERNIGLSDHDTTDLHNTLMSARDFIEATTFNNAKYYAVEHLEKAWIGFLKEDLKTFLDCHTIARGESPPGTADVIDITVTNDNLIISRPNPWLKRIPTTDSEKARRHMAESLDSETRAERRALALQRRKEMERERRKAIRNAYRRVREAKKKKDDDTSPPSTPSSGSSSAVFCRDVFEVHSATPSVSSIIVSPEVPPENGKDEDENEFGEVDDEKKSAKPPPPFTEMTGNKTIMTNFKKHLQETDKEKLNMVNLYNDLETYLSYGNSKADLKKKDTQANYINKTYIDANGKKHVDFEDKVKIRAGDRPKTPVVKEMHGYIMPKIEENFKTFITEKAQENGMDAREFANLSQAELSLRMGNDASMLGGNWNKKGRKGKSGEGPPQPQDRLLKDPRVLKEISMPPVTVHLYEHNTHEVKPRKVHFTKEDGGSVKEETTAQPHSSTSNERSGPPATQKPKGRRQKTGRAQPTKDDREEFYRSLKTSAAGTLTLHMLYFYKYLLKHGEEDGIPLIEKDLFYYIEVQKFKDANHLFADDELLRKKVQSIIDCFLESVTTPALQIDISPLAHEKTLRAAQRYLAGKDVLPNIFDESQLMVFKELLPYWAGFKRSFQPPEDETKRPVTKYQKMLKKRLDTIENYEIPPSDFNLPPVPEGGMSAYTFSLSEGVRWREVSSEEAASMMGTPVDRSETATTIRTTVTRHLPDSSLRRRRQSQSHLTVPGSIVAPKPPGNGTREASSVSVKD